MADCFSMTPPMQGKVYKSRGGNVFRVFRCAEGGFSVYCRDWTGTWQRCIGLEIYPDFNSAESCLDRIAYDNEWQLISQGVTPTGHWDAE